MLGLRLDEPLRARRPEAVLDAAELDRLSGTASSFAATARWRSPSAAVSSAAGSLRACSRKSAATLNYALARVMDVRSSPSGSGISCGASSRSTSRPGSRSGSKTLVERGGLGVSSSTVRNDLAELERRGLMTHPHTSAGRVPTEAGYRLLCRRAARCAPRRVPDSIPLGLSAARAEVEEALQATTEALSQATRLLALVSAPPFESATVRHVEVLLLQANVVMVVVINDTINPSPADGVFRYRFGVYRIRGSVIRLPGVGLFFTRRKLGRDRAPSPGGDLKGAFKKSNTRLKPFNGKRLRRVFSA